MVEGSQGPTEKVEAQPVTQQPLKPHRGTVILVLGILGIVCCFICGIIAWVMGNNDLRQMAAGTMDRSGEGLTRAGKICGMVGVILAIVCIAIQLIFMLLGFGMVALRSSSGPV
jgi:uncharacterized membrane protein YidH (DUF202 family)